MVIYRALGIILLGVGGGLICHYLSRKAQTALRRAEGWCSLVGFIKNEVDCFALPIGEILKRADVSVLSDCGYTGESAPRSLAELAEGTRLTDKDTEKAVRELCAEFGRGYRSEQVARCEYYRRVFEERARALAAELPTKKRLYSTLCASGGLALLILFL